MAKTEGKSKWTVELHDSTEGRQIAFVIDQTNYIEHTVRRILEKYIGAKDGRSNFIQNILLHSSVMGLGQKFKVLQYIVNKEDWPEINSDHYHTVLSLRNAFAHSDTVTTNIRVTVCNDGHAEKTEVFQVMDTITSSGKVKELTREAALDEFLQSFGPLRDYLHNLEQDYAAK